MKKIVYAVYHDSNSEERSKELLQCCKVMGQVHFISLSEPEEVGGVETYVVDKKNPFALFNFLSITKKVIKNEKPDIIVLHDNDCSALIPFIKKNYSNIPIIYDSSELYIPMAGEKNKINWRDGIVIGIKEIITSFRKVYEKKYLKEADVVIAANIERAKIMKKYFGLLETPLVFDNIHRIESEFNLEECKKKYEGIFDDSGFNILFGGGISETRNTFRYITEIEKMDERYRLIIVGSSSEVGRKKYEKLKEKISDSKVIYLGMLPREEFRYCLSKSQINIISFDHLSYNNKFCASGKCYEGLFEGKPILASTNPPLERLCCDYGVGISSDNIVEAIIELDKNYKQYVDNVDKYVKCLKYENRIERLAEKIEDRLSRVNS